MNAKGDDINDSDINQNSNRVRELNNIINAPITREEIEKAIKSLKNNKFSGDDYILNEYIKHSFESISDVYVKLFNIIFDSDSFQNSGYMGILFLFTKIREINMILKILGQSRF